MLILRNKPFSQLSLSLLLLAIFSIRIETATTHKHGHHGGERMEDGSFRSRDHDHQNADDGEHYMEFDHEAMLGSVKEAEEFHQLSPEESKNRLHILVSTKIDTNSDQFIDKHELKAHILRSFK